MTGTSSDVSETRSERPGLHLAHPPPEDSLLARACRQWVDRDKAWRSWVARNSYIEHVTASEPFFSHMFTFMKWSQDYFSYIRLISHGTGGCKWSGVKPR